MSKMLLAATDFHDEMYRFQGDAPDQGYIQDLSRYLAGLGVEKWEWVICQRRSMEKGYPGGFDLLAAACQAAHDHGMEFHPVFKPFEGCTGLGIPPGMPRPEGVPLVERIGGPMAECDPWLAEHPELRYARRPGEEDPGRAIAAIDLIKDDDRPLQIGLDDLSIWTSPVHGNFRRYEGPVQLVQRVAWLPGFPRHYRARVLSLEGLNIPADQQYIVVRWHQHDEMGFANTLQELTRLRDDSGQVVPHTPGAAHHVDVSRLQRRRLPVWRRIVPFFGHPEVQAVLDDAQQLAAHFSEYYSFTRRQPGTRYSLSTAGSVAMARGKHAYLPGALHPIYPEVREYWLSWVDFCIERGCDGVNIRTTNHSDASDERGQYGFNQPVLEACGGRVDRHKAARVSGDAYSEFLMEARRRLHASGRTLGVHVETDMLVEDERPRRNRDTPPNTDWQWQRWVRDIADYVEIRDAWRLRRDSHDYAIDRISAVAHEAGKPVFYQSTIKEMSNVWMDEPGATGRIQWEMDYVRRHPRLAGYILYETASYSRLVDGRFHGSPALPPLLQRHY